MFVLAIFMPIALLGLKFVLKLFIDREPTAPQFVLSVLELPVDIMFLSISLIIGYTIAKPEDALNGLALFVAFIFFAVLVCFLWRRSLRLLDKKYFIRSSLLCFVNYIISFIGILVSVRTVIGVIQWSFR